MLRLSPLLRHVTTEAGLEELRRNARPRLLVGIEAEGAVPRGRDMARSLAVLGRPAHPARMREAFGHLARRLGAAVPDLGRHAAGDSAGLRGRLDPNPTGRAAGAAAGLPRAGGGRKEYEDDGGRVTKAVEWFGYKPHLLADARHEVAPAFGVTDPTAGDDERIEALVDQARRNPPAGRLGPRAYDKAADDGKVQEALHERGVKPVIQNRACRPKGGEPDRVTGGRVPPHVVHDAAGTVFCDDATGAGPGRRATSDAGREKGRGTLKYRRPARVEGFACGSDAKRNAGKSYGLPARVDQEIDLRRFPSIRRATPRFGRPYKGRAAAERVDDRMTVFWGRTTAT